MSTLTVPEKKNINVAKFTNILGRPLPAFPIQIAHSILGLSTFLTLLFNSTIVLLHNPLVASPAPLCHGIFKVGAFCLLADSGEWPRIILLLCCIPIVIGLFPPIAGLLHFYAAFSLSSNTVGVEGGDQLSVNLAALLCLTTVSRCYVWGWTQNNVKKSASRFVPGNVALGFATLQVSYVYFESAVLKLVDPIWGEGSAMWYWVQNIGFSAPQPITDFYTSILAIPWMAGGISWGVIAFELLLCVTILFSRNLYLNRVFLILGISFHALIALTLGLITFGLVMSSALYLTLGTRIYIAENTRAQWLFSFKKK